MIARRAAPRLVVLGLALWPFVGTEAQRPTPGAPLDVAGFRYSRAIPPGEGLTAVTLDGAALAHSRLDDIRIVDSRRRQVPYVIDPVDEPLELALPPLEVTNARTTVDQPLPTAAARRTWYRARLPYAGLPDALLRMRTDERVFRREVAVVTTNTARDAVSYAAMPRLERELWSHEDPATAAPPLDIAIPDRLPADSLFLLVDDGDNRTLPIGGATVRLRTYRLRFFRDSGEAIRVVYGRPDLAAPRYDLALVSDRLRDSLAAPVTLGPERALEDTTTATPRVAFWSVLIGTVVVLLAIIARLVGGNGEQTASQS